MKEQHVAFLAYLLNIAGALYIVFIRKRGDFALYHAGQAFGLGIMTLGLLLAWFILLWILAWIPYVGFIFGIASFSLVIAAYIVLGISCVVGMKNALQSKKQAVPIVGRLAGQIATKVLRAGPFE